MPLLPYGDKATHYMAAAGAFRPRREYDTRYATLFRRRRPCWSICYFVLALVSVAIFGSRMLDEPDFHFARLKPGIRAKSSGFVSCKPDAAHPPSQPPQRLLMNGPPTQSFRDNLRNDTKYITSWLGAGWNNDVMTFMNLIYLGVITERVPILAMFSPSWHIGHLSPVIPFGEVFDVPRFIKESGIHVLEWSEVKDSDSKVVDDLGCWNVWESVQYYEHQPRDSDVPRKLGLDISYTKAPVWVKMMPGNEHDKGASFWALARLGYTEDRDSNLGDVLPSPLHGVTLDPDEHLLCYDYLYYVGGHQMMEYDLEYSPAWRFVGKYLRWTRSIDALAAEYVKQAFGISAHTTSEIPAYITVHVRHGDFENWCWEAETPEDCFAPLSAFERRVSEVQAEIEEKYGIEIPASRVIMTSDETDESWWDEVSALGWIRINHEELQTEKIYGKWYPVIFDSVIQSNGLGFVGTDRSTFSMLSRKRVLNWRRGSVRTVRWGKKGADDH